MAVKRSGNLIEHGMDLVINKTAHDILNAEKTEEIKPTNDFSLTSNPAIVIEETATSTTAEPIVITTEQKQTEQEEKEEDIALSNMFVVEKKEIHEKKQKMYYMKIDNIAWVKKMAKKLNRSESDFMDTVIDSLKNSFNNGNK